MHFCEVLVHWFGKEVADIMSLAYLFPYVCGRNVNLRHIHHCDIGMTGKFAVGVSGTGIDINLVMLKDKFPIAPTLKGFEVVGAHDKTELFVAVLVAQMGKGEDCVGRYRQVKLHIAGTHTVVVVYGQAHNLQPLLVGKEAFALLKGILGRDNIPHLVQIAMGKHSIANNEVPDMDGVERTEEKPYFTQRGKGIERLDY